MVEGARLESVYTLTGIEGSNPSLTAIVPYFYFRRYFRDIDVTAGGRVRSLAGSTKMSGTFLGSLS